MRSGTPAFRRLPFLVAALLLLSAAGSMADDEDKKPRKLPLSIFCFDYALELRAVQVKRGPSEFAEVKLSTANVVDAGMAIAESGTVSLYNSSPEPAPMATIQVADSFKELLLILVPSAVGGTEGEEAGLAYRSHLVERDLARFPLGSSLFVNLSPHLIRIQLDDKTVEIEAGAESRVEPDARPGDVMSVTVEFRAADHWLAVSNSRWAHRMDRRSLITLHLNSQTGRVMMKSIPLRD